MSFRVVLNPIQCCLTKFCQNSCERRHIRNSVHSLIRKSFCELPRFQAQRLHPTSPAFLTEEARVPRRLIGHLQAEWRSAGGAPVELGKPPAKSNGPEREVTKWKPPVPCSLNFPDREQDQPEHGFGCFMLGQNLLRNFAHYRQPRAQLVVALRLVKGLQRFALLNPHQISRFSFHVPYLHVGKGLEGRSIAVLYPPCTACYSAHPARGPSKKTDQAVCLAKREGLQNDGFRLPGRHELSARRRWAGRSEEASPNRAHAELSFLPHTLPSRNSFRHPFRGERDAGARR